MPAAPRGSIQVGVEDDLGAIRIQNPKDLIAIGRGIAFDLCRRQRRPRRTLAGGISDASGEVADQEENVVPEILELTQLVNQHRVTEVQVRCRRIESGLDPQGAAFLQTFDEVLFGQDFIRAATDHGELLFKFHDTPWSRSDRGQLGRTRARIPRAPSVREVSRSALAPLSRQPGSGRRVDTARRGHPARADPGDE